MGFVLSGGSWLSFATNARWLGVNGFIVFFKDSTLAVVALGEHAQPSVNGVGMVTIY